MTTTLISLGVLTLVYLFLAILVGLPNCPGGCHLKKLLCYSLCEEKQKELNKEDI